MGADISCLETFFDVGDNIIAAAVNIWAHGNFDSNNILFLWLWSESFSFVHFLWLILMRWYVYSTHWVSDRNFILKRLKMYTTFSFRRVKLSNWDFSSKYSTYREERKYGASSNEHRWNTSLIKLSPQRWNWEMGFDSKITFTRKH